MAVACVLHVLGQVTVLGKLCSSHIVQVRMNGSWAADMVVAYRGCTAPVEHMLRLPRALVPQPRTKNMCICRTRALLLLRMFMYTAHGPHLHRENHVLLCTACTSSSHRRCDCVPQLYRNFSDQPGLCPTPGKTAFYQPEYCAKFPYPGGPNNGFCTTEQPQWCGPCAISHRM